MDKETREIERQLKEIGDLVNHPGWEIIARTLEEKLKMNENLHDIVATTPDQLFLEIRSRQIASTIIAGWLEIVIGALDEIARQNVTDVKESYIISKEQ